MPPKSKYLTMEKSPKKESQMKDLDEDINLIKLGNTVRLVSSYFGVDISTAKKVVSGCIDKISRSKNIDRDTVVNLLISYGKNAKKALPKTPQKTHPIGDRPKGDHLKEIERTRDHPTPIKTLPTPPQKPPSDVSCESYSLEECEKHPSGGCVVYEGGCIPRRIKDADLINKDPDAYAEKKDTKSLDALVKLASYLYYNYDGGGLTDNAFDSLEYYLRKRTKASQRLYEKIGAPPLKKIATKLPFMMPSLPKFKPGTKELLSRLAVPEVVWSLKLDGTSCLAEYIDGKPQRIFTRGDGTIGGNISDLIPHLQGFPIIPIKDRCYFRGELVVDRKVWEDKYKHGKSAYSNERSFVNAHVNSGTITPGVKDIRFVAYSIISAPISPFIDPKRTPESDMDVMKKLGFEVPDWGTIKNPLVFDIVELYKNKRGPSDDTQSGDNRSPLTTSKYLIDGIVITPNFKNAPSFAFKMLLESQIRSTKVMYVDWRISRYGRYIPVCVYEPVYVDGVRLRKASAFNARYISTKHINTGTPIKIARSGDVIPKIQEVEVDESTQPSLPLPVPAWHWQGADIVLDDIDGNKDVQLRRIEHFFDITEVSGVGEATIEKLWSAGLNTIEAIVGAKVKQMVVSGQKAVKDAEGNIISKAKTAITENAAQKIYDKIREGLSASRMDRLMVASPYFKGIGKKTSHTIFLAYPTLIKDTISNGIEFSKKKLESIKIKGFGAAKLKSLIEDLTGFVSFLANLDQTIISKILEADENRIRKLKSGDVNPKIKDHKFVLTGFMGRPNYNLEDYIYDNGGELTDTINSDVKAVIAANVAEISSKMEAAAKIGVRVYSIEEFSKAFDAPLYHDVSSDSEERIGLE